MRKSFALAFASFLAASPLLAANYSNEVLSIGVGARAFIDAVDHHIRAWGAL